MRKDKNTMFLKLMKDKIGFEVEGFVKAPIIEETPRHLLDGEPQDEI